MHDKFGEKLIQGLNILIVDSNPFMRRTTRTMLTNLGAKSVSEAGDGLAALEAIRTWDPDVMFIEWEMPVLSGLEVMRVVRSPGVFPRPDIPVIMLTSHAKRSYVAEALRTGVNEYLVKPTSAKALRDRLVSIVMHPRRMLKFGDFYVPEPRAALPPGQVSRSSGPAYRRRWRARDDSSVRPLPSEGGAFTPGASQL